MLVGVIDIGGSNIGSVANILDFLNVKKKILKTFKKDIFKSCNKIILPGVGSFKKAMDNLKKNNFIDPLNEAFRSNKPILGICLGMQLMCKSSIEGGESKGLNWFNVDVKKFNIKKTGKIPIIGWNSVNKKKIKYLIIFLIMQIFIFCIVITFQLIKFTLLVSLTLILSIAQ